MWCGKIFLSQTDRCYTTKCRITTNRWSWKSAFKEKTMEGESGHVHPRHTGRVNAGIYKLRVLSQSIQAHKTCSGWSIMSSHTHTQTWPRMKICPICQSKNIETTLVQVFACYFSPFLADPVCLHRALAFILPVHCGPNSTHPLTWSFGFHATSQVFTLTSCPNTRAHGSLAVPC